MENVPSFNQLIQESIINNWDLDALPLPTTREPPCNSMMWLAR